MPCSPGPGHKGIRQVNVRGLVATAFTHWDSRAGDRDLHTHVAVANKVQTGTPAPPSLRSADDVLQTLLGLVDWVSGHDALLVVGHTADGGKCRLLSPEGATSPGHRRARSARLHA